MPPRRGLYAFSAIAAGILLADALPTIAAPIWFALACAALIAAAVTRHRAARPLLAAAALFLGAGTMAARVLTVPDDRLAAPETDILIVRGTVLTKPTPDPVSNEWERPPYARTPSLTFDLVLESVQRAGEWQPASGEVAVFVRVPALDVTRGQRIEVTGYFRPVAAPANPGQRDARRWAAQEGRCGSLSLETAAAIEQFPHEDSLLPSLRADAAALLSALRERAVGALDNALGPATDETGEQSRALLKAMLIGGEDPSLRPVSDDMSRLGIVHILSISGFHLVLVSMVVVFLIRLTGDRGVWEYALAAAAIGLYLLVIPAQAPVVRSGLMVLVLLLTEAMGRRYDRLNVLAWTACALALWRPLDLYSPGFQLSFGVTAALIWRAGDWTEAALAWPVFGMPGVKGRRRRDPRTIWQWLLRQAVGLCVATAIAWTVSSAVVAWHVGVLSLTGVLAGIVLTLPSIAAIAVGFVAMLVALISPGAAEPLGALALFFSELTVRGAHLAAQVPASSMSLPQLPLAWTIATTAVAAVAIAPGGWQRTRTKLAALVCVVWLGGILLLAVIPRDFGAMDRFALPKSSATLIRDADQAVLIDPGSSAHRSGAFTLRRAVAASGAWRIRTVIITGPQTERFSHLPELARTLGVETVLVPHDFEQLAAARPGGDQDRLLRRLAALGVTVRTLGRTEALAIGGVRVGVESPGVIRVAFSGELAETLSLTPLERAERTVLPN